MNILIKNFRPMEKGLLCGFVTVGIPEAGIIINDISVFSGDKGTWVSPPSKPRIKDGQVVKEDGKVIYDEVVSFSSAEMRKAWSGAVIGKLQKAYPEAFITD